MNDAVKKSKAPLITIRILGMTLAFVLCLGLAPASLSQGLLVKEVNAAVKDGLKRKKLANGEYDYYFYENGVKVKNTWKKVTNSAGNSYWYYFGKNGKAYKAYDSVLTMIYKERFVTKAVSGKVYGFDQYGRRIKGAWYSPSTKKLYYFNSDGIYNKTKTAKLRTYAKKGRRAAFLIKALGKYKSRSIEAGGCFEIGSALDDGSRHVNYIFPHLRVVAATNTSGAVETVHLVDAIFKNEA